MSSLKTIAERCGKDISTVSRALRDDPRVKEATREAIKTLAQELGYSPNLAARSLRVGSSKTVWFFIPTVRNPISQTVTEYAAAHLRVAGYELLLAVHGNEEPVFERMMSRLEQGVCDAAIVVPSGAIGCDQLQSMAERNYPVVFMDRHIEACNIPVFTTENCIAARALMKECVADGVDVVVSLFDGNTVENRRNEGIRQEAGLMTLPVLEETVFETVSETALPARVAILGSSQGIVCEFFARHRTLLSGRQITFGVFDGWVGETYPAQKVCVCIQDFEVMAKATVDYLLARIESKSGVSFEINYVPHLEIKTRC